MRRFGAGFIVLLTFMALTSSAPADDDVKAQIAQGVALHDQGDYDGAIVIYEAVLKDHPHDPAAVHELIYSMLSRGKDVEAVAARIEAELASSVEQPANLYSMLGWSYDALKQPAKAEAAFRRGLERDPKGWDLNFNLGVNLSMQERYAEAIPFYLTGLKDRPDHISAWYALGRAYQSLPRAPRAFFCFLRVVVAEPDSERGKASANELWPLLFDGVSETTDATRTGSEITITIPADTPGKDSDTGADTTDADATIASAGVEAVGMSIVAASRFTEEWKGKSDAAFFADALETCTAIVSESADRDDPLWAVDLVFLDEARSKKFMTPMAYDVRRSAGDPAGNAWIESHRKAYDTYRAWAKNWKPAKK
jgi:tetratricopeptide (TPR) repeat protein